ncbi:hypothetical protein B0F90DRAFT_613926 [Multifurca ochricompacta]|uniref:Uncharacterized protein n=1 Tax=Multifurca ochricompacta TaxID=376703 RepID=A0AAD4QMW0_9AGAM|nr:hypothetical protein B0F90DRAFT_613926 [Multifurca ochricompacta]
MSVSLSTGVRSAWTIIPELNFWCLLLPCNAAATSKDGIFIESCIIHDTSSFSIGFAFTGLSIRDVCSLILQDSRQRQWKFGMCFKFSVSV